jgi:hypothetical protein
VGQLRLRQARTGALGTNGAGERQRQMIRHAGDVSRVRGIVANR